MPTSHPTNLKLVDRVLDAFTPGSVLDLCCGSGTYATVLRKRLPKARLVGVEIWEPYVSGRHDAYSRMVVGDALEVVPKLGQFDLAIFLGALEHFEHKRGERMLRIVAEHATTTLVVTPHKPGHQLAVNGNEWEQHRSRWKLVDFAEYAVRDLSDTHRLRVLFGREEQEWWEGL